MAASRSNAAVFRSKIDGLQVSRGCGLLLVAHHPERAKPSRRAPEMELFVRPNAELGFRLCRPPTRRPRSRESQFERGHVQTDRRHPRRQSPADLAAAAGGRQRWRTTVPMAIGARELRAPHGAARRYVVHAASPDQEANFGVISDHAPALHRRIGAPDPARWRCRRAPSSTFDAELPSYDIAQSALGLQRGHRGKPRVFINNLFDERALLSLDRERGRSARVGYLTNRRAPSA